MAERRGLNPSHLSGPPPVSGAIPVRIPPLPLPPMQCAMSAAAPAAMVEGWEATRQKKRKKKHRESEEVAASSSESPRPPATPDSKTESPAPVTAETLTSTPVAAGKACKRKMQEVAAAASSLVGEAVQKEEKRRDKRSKPEAAAATPSPSIPAAATATAQILEVAAEGAAARKEQRRGKLEQGQSGQQPSPVDVHPQGGEAEAVVHGGVSGSKSVGRSRGGKPRVLTDKEILRERILWLREHPVPLPQGFVPAMPNPNSTDQDPKYSSPFGPFFDQFRYIPERRQGRNAPSLPKTPDPSSRPPPQDHPSFLSSQLTANQKAANTTIFNTEQAPSGSQGAVKAKEKKRPDEKMKTEMANPNSTDHDPKYSSPFGPFFDQFCYRPERRRDLNAPSLPKTPDPPARPPPRDNPSFLPSQLTANQKAAKTTTLNRKRPPSVSSSGSQEAVKAKEKKRPDEKMGTMKTEMANPNSIDQDPKYSSPVGAFFDQFCYRPERRRGRNAPSRTKIPDPPARPPPRDHLSFLPFQLTANRKAAKTTTLSRKRPPSVSASGSQEAVKVQGKKRPDEKIDTMKQETKKSPVLSAAEKRSDKYRRLPLNQLVPPPSSPHKLLQERYARDPWKVIVICILCNATRGKEVKKKLDGFFKRYPDAQTACTADPEKMVEYLAPLGFQRKKTNRIQKMSKAYVKEEWTYVTELFGVDKYAADAYAIFCAGRATEVVPKDHKLVDYWKYVCFELPTKASLNAEQAAGVTGQGKLAPAVQQIAVSC